MFKRWLYLFLIFVFAAPAAASQLALTGAGGAGVPVTPVSITQTAATTSNTVNSTYTFSAQNFGTAAASRLIAVATYSAASGANSASGVTIGGIAATSVGQVAGTNGGFFLNTSMWVAAVPTGTSGAVVVTYSGNQNRAGIGVWAIYDAGSATPSQALTSHDTNPVSVSLNVPANGAAIGAALSSTTGTATWAGLVEDFDMAVGGGSQDMTGAHAAFVSAQSGLAVSATFTGYTASGMVAASWGP